VRETRPKRRTRAPLFDMPTSMKRALAEIVRGPSPASPPHRPYSALTLQEPEPAPKPAPTCMEPPSVPEAALPKPTLEADVAEVPAIERELLWSNLGGNHFVIRQVGVLLSLSVDRTGPFSCAARMVLTT